MAGIRVPHEWIALLFRLSENPRVMLGVLITAAVVRAVYTAAFVRLTRCGDEFGYIFWDFGNLTQALAGYRAPGFPVLIEIYESFFPHFGYWPLFQVLCYLVAVIWLYRALIVFGLRSLTAVCVTLPLTVTGPAFEFAAFMCSETMAAAFVVAGCAALFELAARPTIIRWALFSGVSFFVILIKPGFIPVFVVFPICAAILVFRSPLSCRPVTFTVTAFAVIVLPMILFVGGRYMATGHVGLTAFSQILLSGHTTGYLTEDGLAVMEPDVRKLAETILDRRGRLATQQCRQVVAYGLEGGGWWSAIEREKFCFGPWYHIAFIAAIESKTGLLPNPDLGGAYVPWPPSGSSRAHPPPAKPLVGDKGPWSWGGDRWIHETVFKQTGITSADLDGLLREYNSSVLQMASDKYFRWIAGGSVLALKEFLLYLLPELSKKRMLVFSGLVLAAIAAFLMLNSVRRKVFLSVLARRIQRHEAAIIFLAFGLPLASLFLTVLFVYTYSRYVIAPSVLLPAVVGLIAARIIAATLVVLQGDEIGSP